MKSEIFQDSVRLAPQVSVWVAGLTPPAKLPGELALPQIPSNAFGDGSHPTTRLCAGVVDFICRVNSPHSVLDVGTGTGILARIARARGAQFVVGTDIDPDAILVARENSLLDSHAVEILVSSEQPDTWGSKFNLVVANILEEPLCSLAESLTQALAPQGILLLSGFTRLQIPRLRLVFSACGLIFRKESFLQEWALLMFEKDDTSAVIS